MKEALKIVQRQKELLKETWGNKVKVAKIKELTKNRKVACRSGLGNPSLIPCHRDRYPGSRDLYIKKERALTLSYSCS